MSEKKESTAPVAPSESVFEKLDSRDKKDLQTKGWARLYATSSNENPDIPEGYEHLLVESEIVVGLRDVIVYDPAMAEIKIVKTQDRDAPGKQKMIDTGWDIIDGNIARMTYIRSKVAAEG